MASNQMRAFRNVAEMRGYIEWLTGGMLTADRVERAANAAWQVYDPSEPPAGYGGYCTTERVSAVLRSHLMA